MRVQASANGATKRCTPSDGSAAASLSAPAGSPDLKPVDDHHEMGDRVARIQLQLASRQDRGPLEIPGEHLHQKRAADQLGRIRVDSQRLLIEFRRIGEIAAMLRLPSGQIIAVQAGARHRRRLAGGRLRRDRRRRARPAPRTSGNRQQRRPQQAGRRRRGADGSVRSTGPSSLHVRIVRSAAALGYNPINVLLRVLDVAGLAVHAVLRVDLQPRLAGRGFGRRSRTRPPDNSAVPANRRPDN